MIQYMPSKQQREYLKEKGFYFTDIQKAAMIWNVPCYSWEEKLLSLEELAYSTNDDGLKKQIAERIEYEKKAMETFKENCEKKCIYLIEYYNKQYGNINVESYFFRFDDALEFSREMIDKELCDNKNSDSVCIKKHKIYADKQHYDAEKYVDDSDCGNIQLNMKGEITDLYSEEYKDEYEMKKGRFEQHFFTFPLSPVFQRGTIVQHVDTKQIYLVGSSYESWDEYCNGLWEKHKDTLEYWEIVIIVYELTKDGLWSHEHINPLYLTTDIDWSDTDSDYRELLNKMGRYLGGDKSPEREILSLTRKHADRCSERSFEKAIYSAKKLSDIMC